MSLKEMRNLESSLKSGRISISDVARGMGKEDTKYDDVFVVNTSDLDGLREKGDVLITVQTGVTGEPKLIRIPKTWIPISLTSFVPKEAILQSTTIREAINNGSLTLINVETATKILNSAPGREEQQSIKMKEHFLDEDQMKDIVKKGGPQSDTIKKVLADRAKVHAQREAAPEDNVNPQVVAIANREELDDRGMLAAVRAIQNKLTERDLHYIMGRVNSTKFPNVVNLTRELLAELNEESES
jgi:hypothetical protein